MGQVPGYQFSSQLLDAIHKARSDSTLPPASRAESPSSLGMNIQTDGSTNTQSEDRLGDMSTHFLDFVSGWQPALPSASSRGSLEDEFLTDPVSIFVGHCDLSHQFTRSDRLDVRFWRKLARPRHLE